MLVSHTKKFIYLKTVKTAGSSVEAALEPYCLPPGGETAGPGQATVTEYGIVGARGSQLDAPFRNHMPAAEICERLGGPKWDGYLKFCNVRNPFDKVVSAFWFKIDKADAAALGQQDFDAVRRAFKAWLERGEGLPRDEFIFAVDGQSVLDDFVRYEQLEADLERILERLGIPRPALPRLKANHRRHRNRPFPDYYDAEAASLVLKDFKTQFELFGYREDSWIH